MKELLNNIGAVRQPNSDTYHLRTGATYIILRHSFGFDKLYCEVGSIYVGEINKSRLTALYYGLTGQKLLDYE